MARQSGDLFAREPRTIQEPDELAERRAAEAMAEKLRREADRFLHRRPRTEAEERPGA